MVARILYSGDFPWLGMVNVLKVGYHEFEFFSPS